MLQLKGITSLKTALVQAHKIKSIREQNTFLKTSFHPYKHGPLTNSNKKSINNPQ